MIIKSDEELKGMQEISKIVAQTLSEMRSFSEIGMTTKEIDEFGGKLLKKLGAKSAPYESYKFPGYTCICVNNEVAHGIPHKRRKLEEGDLINIDVSAEKGGFWSDNGGSFIMGEDLNGHEPLVQASKDILKKAIYAIKGGVKINEVGRIIETEAKKRKFTVIKNLAGHGVGRSLHEPPEDILNYRDRFNRDRFKRNSVVAIETFISTKSTFAVEQEDGWTLVGNKGGFVTQHEHTIVVTDSEPIILTSMNGVWD